MDDFGVVKVSKQWMQRGRCWAVAMLPQKEILHGSCNRSNTVMLTDAGKWSITRHLSVEITQVTHHTLSSHFKMHVKDYLRHYDNMLATVVGLLKSIYIYTHHTLSRSIYSLPPPMLSSTSITPLCEIIQDAICFLPGLQGGSYLVQKPAFHCNLSAQEKEGGCLPHLLLAHLCYGFDGILQFGLGNC